MADWTVRNEHYSLFERQKVKAASQFSYFALGVAGVVTLIFHRNHHYLETCDKNRWVDLFLASTPLDMTKARCRAVAN